jgi:hypothetical protein
LLTAGWIAAGSAVLAQQPRPYDGIQAGLDAFRLAEEQRQAQVAQQLAQTDQFKFWYGLPISRGETIYYGYLPGYGPVYPAAAFTRANRDYAYAYGHHAYASGPLTVFEPWPYVPGDIYGYIDYRPIRQSIGQWQGQTGPSRWESHPVYDPPLPDYRPLPPVDSPLLDGTPYATPREVIPPQAPPPPAPPPVPRKTPREF